MRTRWQRTSSSQRTSRWAQRAATRSRCAQRGERTGRVEPAEHNNAGFARLPPWWLPGQAGALGMGASKDRVVVALQEVRPAVQLPARLQAGDHVGRGDRLVHRAGGRAAPERKGVEDLHPAPAAQAESLDHVAAVHFGVPCGHGGEVPALGWRGPPPAFPSAQAGADQPARNRTLAGRGHALREELPADRRRSMLAQRVVALQLPARPSDRGHHLRWRAATWLGRTARVILPIHLRQHSALRELHPERHGRSAHSPAPRCLPVAVPTSNVLHQGASPVPDKSHSFTVHPSSPLQSRRRRGPSPLRPSPALRLPAQTLVSCSADAVT